jgi:hypothetical protein
MKTPMKETGTADRRPAGPSRDRIRLFAALCLLVAVAAWGSFSTFFRQISIERQNDGPNALVFFEQRFGQVRPFLHGRKVVGYIANVSYEEALRRERDLVSIEDLAQYRAAQYALAPVIVRFDHKPDIVIGNFLSAGPTEALLRSYNLVPYKNFGGGLFLFRRGEQ